jgi:hypothetical protein
MASGCSRPQFKPTYESSLSEVVDNLRHKLGVFRRSNNLLFSELL